MYELKPSQHDDCLFFKMEGEEAERHGAIGYLRADFGRDGREFFFTWFDIQSQLKTPDFKYEFDAVITSLRDDGNHPPFASRSNLKSFMAATPGTQIEERGKGYEIQTLGFSYLFRCSPGNGDYEVYCFAYDNSLLLAELEKVANEG